MKLSECINFLLTDAQNSVHLYFKKELAQYNVTPIQYSLLYWLWEEDQQTPSQLAQYLHLDTSTVTGILSRLEAKELIVRDFCKTDRRRIIVCLTDAGRALQSPIERCILNANLRVSQGLSPETLALLRKNLETLTGNANALIQQ